MKRFCYKSTKLRLEQTKRLILMFFMTYHGSDVGSEGRQTHPLGVAVTRYVFILRVGVVMSRWRQTQVSQTLVQTTHRIWRQTTSSRKVTRLELGLIQISGKKTLPLVLTLVRVKKPKSYCWYQGLIIDTNTTNMFGTACKNVVTYKQLQLNITEIHIVYLNNSSKLLNKRKSQYKYPTQLLNI